MILTQKFRPAASWRVKLAMFVLAAAVLPLAATAVSVGEDAESAEAAPAASRTVESPPAKETKSRNAPTVDRRRRDVTGTVVAHWRFQQGLDGHVAESSQLIEDSSGNDRHGRVIGGPKYRSVNLPESNLALVFDGYDDHIAVADHPLFHLAKSFTIEAYIEIDCYPESAAEECHIVFRGDNRNGFDPWFLSVTQSGQLRFLIADALNEASVVQSPKPLPTGVLLHVAATLDDETGKQSVFINGVRAATKKTMIRAAGALGGTAAGIGIGDRYIHSNQAFRGTIDELRISAAALTPREFLSPPVSEKVSAQLKNK